MANEIPTFCKGGIVRNIGPDYYVEASEDLPVPSPGSDDLLVRLNATGLCLTDHHFMKGDWGVPMLCDCAGHEGAGVVVALGCNIDPNEWKVGDRVGCKPIFDICHVCEFCRGGKETWCRNVILSGQSRNGSYAQYITSPARYTTRIPDGVPDIIAGPIMCSGATMYAAIKDSKIKAGEWLVLPGGGGGVGHMAMPYGRALGLRVCIVDTSIEKEEMCLEMGAEAFVDFRTEPDVVAKVHQITGGGGQAVIVAGSTGKSYELAGKLIRRCGTMVCVSLPPRGEAIAGMDANDLIFQGYTIIPSLVASQSDTMSALDFAARGLVKPRITVYPFKDFNKALKLLVSGNIVGRAVIDFNA